MSGLPPLSGLRVLEFGQIAAGPFAGSLLADLGADVVKVERPDGGDGMRSWPPFRENNGQAFSENFTSLNRNKRSIAVDLKDSEAIARLKQLCSGADIIVENFRPQVLARLGLGYESIKQSNPGIVYCSVSGYGQIGPYAQKGAFDVTVQAMSGVMSVTGEDGAAPVKCGVPIADFAAGLYAAYSILAAILRRNQTGEGAYIDCSMLGSLIGIAALQTSEYFGNGVAPKRMGSAHPRNAPYQAFLASDAYFVIAAGNDKLWQAVCDAVEMPELAHDPRFQSQALRAKYQDTLVEILAPQFLKKTAQVWLTEMDQRGVPCAPINDYAQILHDPHVTAMGMVMPIDLPNGAHTQTTAFPVKISNFDFQISKPPPALGADNQAIWQEWSTPTKRGMNTPPSTGK